MAERKSTTEILGTVVGTTFKLLGKAIGAALNRYDRFNEDMRASRTEQSAPAIPPERSAQLFTRVTVHKGFGGYEELRDGSRTNAYLGSGGDKIAITPDQLDIVERKIEMLKEKGATNFNIDYDSSSRNAAIKTNIGGLSFSTLDGTESDHYTVEGVQTRVRAQEFWSGEQPTGARFR